MTVGTLEEMIDDNHAIVSTSMGPEYYVGILSFVNRDLLEVGCTVLLHNKVQAVVGILSDEVDPMVSVMKVEKAPVETYADIGGLHDQVLLSASQIHTSYEIVIRFKKSRKLSSYLLLILNYMKK